MPSVSIRFSQDSSRQAGAVRAFGSVSGTHILNGMSLSYMRHLVCEYSCQHPIVIHEIQQTGVDKDVFGRQCECIDFGLRALSASLIDSQSRTRSTIYKFQSSLSSVLSGLEVSGLKGINVLVAVAQGLYSSLRPRDFSRITWLKLSFGCLGGHDLPLMICCSCSSRAVMIRDAMVFTLATRGSDEASRSGPSASKTSSRLKVSFAIYDDSLSTSPLQLFVI